MEHRKKVFLDFKAFNFHPSVAAGIKAAGYERPTPIQAKAIIPLMEGLDVMGLAQTGTGKNSRLRAAIIESING